MIDSGSLYLRSDRFSVGFAAGAPLNLRGHALFDCSFGGQRLSQ